MNSDDFEKRLARQTFRSVPTEWRREILEIARNNSASSRRGFFSTLNHQLSTLLWPCPQAWAGLAAIWIVIFAVNFTTQEPTTKITKSEPPSRGMILAMKEQRRLYLELVGMPTNEIIAEPPKEIAPRPQSKRKNEFEIV